MTQTFERLGALDSFFLDCETETNPMHIGAVCVFEASRGGGRPVSISRLRRHVESRLDAIPRYRQRIARVPLEGHPVWVDDANFRIQDHVRAIALAAPQSCARLEETVSWIFSQPLSPARPLWEIWLIEGLQDGGVALVCKVHHCLADGLGGASLLCAVLGTEPFAESAAATPWRPRSFPGGAELLAAAVSARLRGVAGLLRRAATQVTTSPRETLDEGVRIAAGLRHVVGAAWRPRVRTCFDGVPGASRRFLWWSVPLEDIKGLGRQLGGTVNDVVLALVAEAFAQTSVERRSGTRLRVLCPVGLLHATPTTLGNRVAAMLVDLPVGERTIRSRFQAVLAATRSSKQSSPASAALLLEELGDAVAPSLLSAIESAVGGASAFNLVVTNVPGPRFPLYLFGHKMTEVVPFVPLLRQNLGIATFSYDGKLFWGFHVDASCIDAVRQLRHGLEVALERLSLLAEIPLPPLTRHPTPLHAESKTHARAQGARRTQLVAEVGYGGAVRWQTVAHEDTGARRTAAR